MSKPVISFWWPRTTRRATSPKQWPARLPKRIRCATGLSRSSRKWRPDLAYRGPHKLILNKNSTNLGIGGHVNRIMELTQGELVVAPQVMTFPFPNARRFSSTPGKKSGGRATSVFSSYQAMSEKASLEFVREHQAGLQSFRSMRRIDARRKNASALRLRFSQSLASLRQRLSQAMVRSTTQRRGSTTNPLA